MEAESWEVELKFHLDESNLFENRLVELGFVAVTSQTHEDTYFRHPSRDFKLTDEAFRLRVVNQRACLTYKGPRITGPVKVREEIELTVDASFLPQWRMLCERLGFQAMPEVRKTRREFTSHLAGFTGLTVVIDLVEDLGEFVEIEKIISDKEKLSAAQSDVMALAKRLGLKRVQPRSYLDQLLEFHGL